MKIRVDVGGRDFGGYWCEDFRITAGYSGNEPDADDIPFGRYPQFFEELSAILLGQTVASDLKPRWSDPIVFAGETIARLHVRRISEEWYGINFDDTPWAPRIRALKRRYVEHVTRESLASGDLDVHVHFSFLDQGRQRSGNFTVTRPVARWLGEQLLALSDAGAGPEVSVEVHNDKHIAEPTEA